MRKATNIPCILARWKSQQWKPAIVHSASSLPAMHPWWSLISHGRRALAKTKAEHCNSLLQSTRWGQLLPLAKHFLVPNRYFSLSTLGSWLVWKPNPWKGNPWLGRWCRHVWVHTGTDGARAMTVCFFLCPVMNGTMTSAKLPMCIIILGDTT